MQTTPTIAELYESNQGLVHLIVKNTLAKYGFYHDGTGRALEEDLFQEGLHGLFLAARKYDPSRGKFSTYAYWWINKYVRNAAKDICDRRRKTVSLDASVGNDDEDGDSLLDFCADETPTAFENVARRDDWAHVAELLRGLTERERRIVELRFGLFGSAEHPLREIGEEMGISVQRVHILLSRILGRLRQRTA